MIKKQSRLLLCSSFIFLLAYPAGRLMAKEDAPGQAPAAVKDLAPSPALVPTQKPSAPTLSRKYTKQEAVKILKIAEEIRSLDKAEILVELTTKVAEQTTVYKMKILRSTGNRAFIDFLAPDEERGRRMLAQKKKYWSTFPDSSRVVAISRKEMIGNSVFALADLFQLDADEDYDPEIVAEEVVDGVALLKLNLKAKHAEAPYDQIQYWVRRKDSFPIRAEFYGLSGKLLKTLTFDSTRVIAGRLRPDVSRMVDNVTADRISWWKTLTMKPASIPESVFTKEYLQSK